MKNILLFSLIALVSCSKSDDITANRPIKKDVTPPTIVINQPSVVSVGEECDMKIVATDNMGLRAIRYYENGCLVRTFETPFTPGRSSLYWEYTFPLYMYTDKMAVRVVAEDMAGNTSETELIINSN